MITQLALATLAGSSESKKSGPIGLAVILVLCVVCYFLFKSLSKHLRKVREEFPGQQRPAEPTEQVESAEPTGATETPADNVSLAKPQGPPDSDA